MRNLGEHFNKRAHLMQLILLTHEINNHKLDICWKISPLNSQQLIINVFM